ncbi:methyltransferase N6AMT1-like isoform X1 [Neocloeon triangulifer]|uniref:methyltransferase N6AMT1-like isoform X1 n=1 Tax=Neocloeon triangulifer TaxID=2078957 RepID=UPI00286EBF96|nr:methyltransferase N6AMT1-like isoform X1 [Neocloeon triangulifer]
METPFTSHLSFNHIYEPAEDSFILMDAIEEDGPWLRDEIRPALCVEIGSGSGVVCSAVAKFLKTFCLAIDINPLACRATKETARRHGASVECVNADLVTPLLPAIRNKVDLLIFNPPYVPTETVEIASSKIAHTWAGGLRGRQVMDRLFPLVPDLLSSKGVFYLVLVEENKPLEVEEIFLRQGFKCKFVKRRAAGRERLCVLRVSKIIM